jgi:hypothetical protein
VTAQVVLPAPSARPTIHVSATTSPTLLTLGLRLTAAFVGLRWSNLYGDARPWEPLTGGLRTLMSFLACTKYPPSLLFACMMLGPALVALALADPPTGPLAKPFVTFGRVPLFYFLGHFFLIHAVAVVVALAFHGRCDWLLANPGPDAPLPPPDAGFGLPGVYAVWVLVVLAMYGPCRWYAGVKRRHPGGVLMGSDKTLGRAQTVGRNWGFVRVCKLLVT